MEEENQKKPQKLNYRLVESTSEDPEYPLYELLKGNQYNSRISFKRLALNSLLHIPTRNNNSICQPSQYNTNQSIIT